jgi:hypothetical protein
MGGRAGGAGGGLIPARCTHTAHWGQMPMPDWNWIGNRGFGGGGGGPRFRARAAGGARAGRESNPRTSSSAGTNGAGALHSCSVFSGKLFGVLVLAVSCQESRATASCQLPAVSSVSSQQSAVSSWLPFRKKKKGGDATRGGRC